MFRFLFAPVLILAGLLLAGCTSSDEDSGDAPKKAAAPLAELHAPTTATDSDWKLYLQQVVSRNMAGVTDRVFPYYLPANSTVPTPGDAEGRSQFDRQLENVTAAVTRTVLPGNMLAFGSPDSAKMADLITSAFGGGKADALKGSQVLFIGSVADQPRVQAAVEATGAKFIFVEAK
ncbi:hypothetical protein BH11PSE14_BH11PSE14_00910 [soil metagenome]